MDEDVELGGVAARVLREEVRRYPRLIIARAQLIEKRVLPRGITGSEEGIPRVIEKVW